MRKLFLILIILIISKFVFAQKELVTLDEHHKYIYYQVVEMPGLTADTLYQKCLAGLKKKYGFKTVTADGTTATVKSKTMLYSSQTYVKHEDGELSYTLHAEFKDFKYRFWLTDFVFKPYQRNRYGVYERSPGGIETPLEQVKEKIDARVLDNYLEQIGKYGKQIGDDMKNYTATPVKKVIEPVKGDSKKW